MGNRPQWVEEQSVLNKTVELKAEEKLQVSPEPQSEEEAISQCQDLLDISKKNIVNATENINNIEHALKHAEVLIVERIAQREIFIQQINDALKELGKDPDANKAFIEQLNELKVRTEESLAFLNQEQVKVAEQLNIFTETTQPLKEKASKLTDQHAELQQKLDNCKSSPAGYEQKEDEDRIDLREQIESFSQDVSSFFNSVSKSLTSFVDSIKGVFKGLKDDQKAFENDQAIFSKISSQIGQDPEPTETASL